MNEEQNIEDLENFDLANEPGLEEMNKALKQIEDLESESNKINSDEEINIDENAEQEPLEEEEKKKSEKPKKQEEKPWKLKRRRFQSEAAKNEAERLRDLAIQENEALKQKLRDVEDSEAYHYAKSAYGDLDRAKALKRKAIEEGDIDALEAADAAYIDASYAINDLKRYAANEEMRKQQTQSYSSNQSVNSDLNNHAQELAATWLEDHPYLQPQSSEYNPEMAITITKFINDFDNDLKQRGQQSAYFSDEYFDIIDNYIDKIKKTSSQLPHKKNNISPHVGGVRNSYNTSVTSGSNTPRQIVLTADEKIMCANADLDEKAWLREKIKRSMQR